MKKRTDRRHMTFAIASAAMLALVALAAGSGLAVPGPETPADREWPMWGGTPSRNMVSPIARIAIDFEPLDNPEKQIRQKRILWIAMLGSQTYGNPVVAGGKVFVGTNNGARYRPKHQGDRGCVLAFAAKSGKLLWQLTREKLPQGRVNDWPEQGICSAPCVIGQRMFVVTNRAELLCLDTEGFHDGENDGPLKNEQDRELQDADIVWNLDMIEQLGVFPHNLATSSPVVIGDLVFLLTSNGVDEAHKQVVSPRSPSFIAVDKHTGKIVWEDATPADRILHGQWGSPAVGVVNGQTQVYFGGGDGWLYALEAKTGKHLWKCDLNPKDSRWLLSGRGSRNNILSTPVFYDNSVIVGVGQDPDHGNGVGHLYRIDARKRGDVSQNIAVNARGKPLPPTKDYVDLRSGERIIPNPHSAVIWHYGGTDETGTVTGTQGDEIFRRTMSTVAVKDGLVYVADLAGFVHCLDLKTGRRHWQHDLLSEVWGSPMVAGHHVLIGDADGGLTIFETGKQRKLVRTVTFQSSIFTTPTIADGVMYISDRSQLYAIDVKPKPTR